MAWAVLVLIPQCGSFFAPGSLLLPVSQSGASCCSGTAASSISGIFRRDRCASGTKICCSSSQPAIPPPVPPPEAIDRKEVGARLRDLVTTFVSLHNTRKAWLDWVSRGEQQDQAKLGRANADDVMDLLHWMIDNGVQPELRSYTAMLNACAAAVKFGGVPIALCRESLCSCILPGFYREKGSQSQV